MSKKKDIVIEEFKTLKTKEGYLNRDIQRFRGENPNYEIFNVSISGTGGQYGGTHHYWVIWRLKK